MDERKIERDSEDLVQGIIELNELSDDEKQQCWNGLCDLQRRTVGVRGKIQIAVDSFREAADEVDRVWWDCKIAHVAGTTGGIISGCLALASATAVTGVLPCQFCWLDWVLDSVRLPQTSGQAV